MAPENTETMLKAHEAALGCFQGKSFFCGPFSKNIGGQTFDLKHANGAKQTSADSENDGSVNTEKLAAGGEYCARPIQQDNYYFWSTASPNIWKELYYQSQSLDGYYYPANQWNYFPTNWFPQIPMQILPQTYQPNYNFQEFQYFVVIDFEATCDKDRTPHPQEIIEFPSVLVNSRTGQIEDSFQIYVRPTYNQVLTDFCRELTGIQQAQVDKGVLLSDALLMHDKWLEDKGIKQSNFAIVTWSNWDCRVMLESECRFKKIGKPSYFNRWINLKIPFGKVFNARCNLKEAVELAGLTWEGRAHCGLDDAKNTARLLAHLMHLGSRLSITNSLLYHLADDPNAVAPQQQIVPPPDYGLDYQPYKHKNYPPFFTLIPFPQIQADSLTKDPNVFCHCGVASMKRVVQKPGSLQGNLLFGCGNWTANRGAACSFMKLAPAFEPVNIA